MNVLAMNAGGGSSRAMLYAIEGTPALEPPVPLWTGERETNDAPLGELFRDFPAATVDVVAHRVVHGGLDPNRKLEQVIDDGVLATIRAAVPLAPAHDRAALDGIAFTQERFAQARQVAIFDDALGHDAPELAQTVTGPPEWRERFGIRRIGFHGISHRDVIPRVQKLLGRERAKIVSVHLGSGASASAFDGERIVETTMGMTPMDGAMMGTRAGAVDPGVIFHLLRNGVDAGNDRGRAQSRVRTLRRQRPLARHTRAPDRKRCRQRTRAICPRSLRVSDGAVHRLAPRNDRRVRRALVHRTDRPAHAARARTDRRASRLRGFRTRRGS